MPKHELTNEDALSLVTRSIYLHDKPDFVVCLAVGYSKRVDGVSNKRAVLEAFRELLSADDWEERTLQLWTAKTGTVTDVCPEEL